MTKVIQPTKFCLSYSTYFNEFIFIILLFYYTIAIATETCPYLRPPLFGYVDYSYTSATYSCIKHFSLVGDATRMCNFRTWTGDEPKCKSGKYAVLFNMDLLYFFICVCLCLYNHVTMQFLISCNFAIIYDVIDFRI